MAARLAILKAARQLAVEANVHVTIRNFQIINQARLRNLNTHVIISGPKRFRHPSASTIEFALWYNVGGSKQRFWKMQCDVTSSFNAIHREMSTILHEQIPTQHPDVHVPCAGIAEQKHVQVSIVEIIRARLLANLLGELSSHTR